MPIDNDLEMEPAMVRLTLNLTGGMIMMKKATILRFFTALLLVLLIHTHGVSQGYDQSEYCFDKPVIICCADNQPYIIESLILLDDWMVLEEAFKQCENCFFLLESWMIDIEGIEYSPEGMVMISGWMMNEEFEEYNDESELMLWMIEFEPLVIRRLMIEEIEFPGIEKWMFENDYASDEEFYLENDETTSWMLN